jgi:hypothetical protein
VIGWREPISSIAAESDAARFCRRERILRPLADLLPFMLRKGRQQVDHELIGVRVVRRNEVDAALHQAGNKMDVPGQAVELCDYQRGLGFLGSHNRSR